MTPVNNQNVLNGKVLLALNVGRDQKSKSVFITDGVRQGNHRTLVVSSGRQRKTIIIFMVTLRIDGLQSNLTHMVDPLLLGIQFKHTNLCAFNQKNHSTCNNITTTCSLIYVGS